MPDSEFIVGTLLNRYSRVIKRYKKNVKLILTGSKLHFCWCYLPLTWQAASSFVWMVTAWGTSISTSHSEQKIANLRLYGGVLILLYHDGKEDRKDCIAICYGRRATSSVCQLNTYMSAWIVAAAMIIRPKTTAFLESIVRVSVLLLKTTFVTFWNGNDSRSTMAIYIHANAIIADETRYTVSI